MTISTNSGIDDNKQKLFHKKHLFKTLVIPLLIIYVAVAFLTFTFSSHRKPSDEKSTDKGVGGAFDPSKIKVNSIEEWEQQVGGEILGSYCVRTSL